MENIIGKRRRTTFYPCGLTIPEERIFDSARNLGLSLMAALTGIPTEDVQLNRSEISIGLGCFGLVGINCADYNEGDDVSLVDETTDWSLLSTIRYTLNDKGLGFGEDIAVFGNMFLNIIPEGLLSKEHDDLGAIQFFGPSRLLRRLHSSSTNYESGLGMAKLDIGNYLEGGLEPNDAILTPSEDEYELFWDEENPSDKFRMLLNMITSFASTLSMKLMYHGTVGLATVFTPSFAAQDEMDWLPNGKIAPAWKPSMKDVAQYIKETNLKKKDIDPKVRKILWPK